MSVVATRLGSSSTAGRRRERAGPPPAVTAAPRPAPAPATTAAAAPVRVAAVGDVHPPSASANAAATAAEAAQADVILGLGDYQYPDGSLADFNAYFDRDWGPLVPKMYPVFGPTHDKDWQADQPLSYFNGAGAHGYRSPVALKPLTPYSFDRGAWHFIALPDACFRVSGCDPAPITAWLQRDLDAHPQACTLAYWHQPYFASTTTKHTAYDAVRPWVDLLYAHHVDVVLTGHQHAYERLGPQNPSRQADPTGLAGLRRRDGRHRDVPVHRGRGARTARCVRRTPTASWTSRCATAATTGASPRSAAGASPTRAAPPAGSRRAARSG